jgi:hypothetical protein
MRVIQQGNGAYIPAVRVTRSTRRCRRYFEFRNLAALPSIWSIRMNGNLCQDPCDY